MPGKNRFHAAVLKSAGIYSEQPQGPCVFVSYKGDDKPAARAVVEVLKNNNIDYYFDEHDQMLRIAHAGQDHAGVVRFIEEGVAASTHILAVISNKTKESWWVSFEIGSGRRKKAEVAYLALQDVHQLPSYLQIATQLKTDIDVGTWIRNNFGAFVTKSYTESSVSIPNVPYGYRSSILFYDRD